MKKGKGANKDSWIWKDTGKHVEGKKLFKSILGNYALLEDGFYLVAFDRNRGRGIESYVD